MNSQEAREVLLRLRPGGIDEHDPDVSAALDQAARDPELAAWLKEHYQFQARVRHELRGMTPPRGLREQILSEKRSRLETRRPARKVVAVAVCALVVVAVITLFLAQNTQDDDRLATFRMRMVKTALRGYAMEVETDEAARIREHLTKQQAHADWQSPPGLDAMPLLGCAVLKWQSQPATMICYGTNRGPELWLFIVEADALPNPPGETERLVEKVNRLLTVSWTRDGRTYVLAGDVSETELLELTEDRG